MTFIGVFHQRECLFTERKLRDPVFVTGKEEVKFSFRYLVEHQW